MALDRVGSNRKADLELISTWPSCEFSGLEAMVSRSSAQSPTDGKGAVISARAGPRSVARGGIQLQVADVAQPVEQARDDPLGLAGRTVVNTQTWNEKTFIALIYAGLRGKAAAPQTLRLSLRAWRKSKS